MKTLWIIIAYLAVGLIACAVWNVIDEKRGCRDVSPITWEVDHHYETVFIWPIYLIMLIICAIYNGIHWAVEKMVDLIWWR